LGRREKVARHSSADFLLHSVGGGGDFVDTVIAVVCSYISAFLCALMFCFKGAVSQDFSLQVFFIIFPQDSENLQICGLTKLVTFADLPHVGQFANLRFANPIFFAICGFAKFIADLQLPQIRKFFIFLLTNTYLKCSNSNF
jgi:hypothetical protein